VISALQSVIADTLKALKISKESILRKTKLLLQNGKEDGYYDIDQKMLPDLFSIYTHLFVEQTKKIFSNCNSHFCMKMWMFTFSFV